MRINSALYVIFLLASFDTALAQESIFSSFKHDLAKADQLCEQQAYSEAIMIYEQLELKSNQPSLTLKLADAYFYDRQYAQATKIYARVHEHELDIDQQYQYAYALHASGKYEYAISQYQKCQELQPDNIELPVMVWQLQNLDLLLEDSIYYHVNSLSINSEFSENGPHVVNSTLYFASNRPEIEVIHRIDARTSQPFSDWFASFISNGDSTSDLSYSTPVKFGHEIKSKFYKGAFSFDGSGKKMVFSKSNYDGKIKTPQLYFAELNEKNKWVETNPFPYNNSKFSFKHPFIANDGNKLYFSSDMEGGYGGMDLYVTEFVDQKWSKPVNLGEGINSSKDEGHPYIHHNTLYFSSNGHPGLGGIDIFKANILSIPSEVINLGYPINTHFDDFSITLDSAGSSGYFVSDRNGNDDIYEVLIEARSFPISVHGVVKYKDAKTGSSPLLILGNARLELIDKSKQEVVASEKSDPNGQFSIEIPYDSQFLLRISQKEFGTAVVSMEIPKNYQINIEHNIVIVKDPVNTIENNEYSNF